MTVKDDLRALIDLLDDESAAEALEYLRWLLAEGQAPSLGA